MIIVFIYKTVAGINISMICNDISRLADQDVCPRVAPCGALWRDYGNPPDPLSIAIARLFDASMTRLFDASMLVAGLSLVLVAG